VLEFVYISSLSNTGTEWIILTLKLAYTHSELLRVLPNHEATYVQLAETYLLLLGPLIRMLE
jgi:hypothetical protein